MQVRHIEEQQLKLEALEKLQLEQQPGLQDEKPWEELVQCLALLAAVHMQPCQAAAERKDEEKKRQPKDDEPPLP
jgi:hypothetical protein